LQLGDEDEDDDWIEQRRQTAVINELQQAGARFFEVPWAYEANESSWGGWRIEPVHADIGLVFRG